ncbi:MAG: ParB N-terminal domain-containing protein [Bryobacterales bacterium]|nr:ParB N-terminal domain-containing protein [Bryobacterales bacterium]
MNLVNIPINDIHRDGGTQPRAALDWDAVHDYTDAMSTGAKFPAVTVFYDGERYWLADGFHRVQAAYAAEFETIECDLRQGTLEDAQWFSFSANRTNGLRRTNDDKQRAVRAAITHPKGAELSNRQIAVHVGVDEGTVRNWREKLTAEIPQSTKRKGRDGRTINTSKIGSKTTRSAPAKAPASAIAEPGDDNPSQTDRSVDGTPESDDGTTARAAWTWCKRIHLTTFEITQCLMKPNDLAAAIRNSDSRERLIHQLEKTRDYLSAILAETVAD